MRLDHSKDVCACFNLHQLCGSCGADKMCVSTSHHKNV
jgi:hypothetical protein